MTEEEKQAEPIRTGIVREPELHPTPSDVDRLLAGYKLEPRDVLAAKETQARIDSIRQSIAESKFKARLLRKEVALQINKRRVLGQTLIQRQAYCWVLALGSILYVLGAVILIRRHLRTFGMEELDKLLSIMKIYTLLYVPVFGLGSLLKPPSAE